jgi:hypothetical protein
MEQGYGDILGLKRIFITLVLIMAAVIVISLYKGKISTEMGVLVSVITFVYGFFINSMFTFIQRKYNDFATNMADLNGNIQTLHNLVNLSGEKKFIKDMKTDLREFIMSLKELSPKYYYETQVQLEKIFRNLNDYKITDKKREVLLSRIINALRDISINRERIELFGERYFVGETKALIYTMTGLMGLAILTISINIQVFFIF